jgi:hypothetical protein
MGKKQKAKIRKQKGRQTYVALCLTRGAVFFYPFILFLVYPFILLLIYPFRL